MALKSNVQNIVGSVWTVLDDLRETVTYKVYASDNGDYNDTTGVVTRTETTETLTTQAVFTRYLKREIDGQAIRPDDRKVLIPNAKISAEPKVNDRITRADGTTWEVQEIQKDPLEALWVLKVRQ